MSSFWLRLTTILSLSCMALSVPGSSRLIWKDFGGSITIQCSTSEKGNENLNLLRGLHKQVQLFVFDNSTGKTTIHPDIKHRLEIKGDLSKIDILITNLTVEDTGVYWCMYKKFDQHIKLIQTEGQGSVLLVVKGAAQECSESISPSQPDISITLVLACAFSSGSIVLILVLVIWMIPKIKAWRATMRPTQATTNDVYEDMRATLRR